LYKPKTSAEVLKKLESFLASHNLKLSDIDVALMGFSSDVNFDKLLVEMLSVIEKETCIASYKHLCGEYHTASAFAMWAATKIIEKQHLPKAMAVSDKRPDKIKHLLIINQYLGINYSFTLLSQC